MSPDNADADSGLFLRYQILKLKQFFLEKRSVIVAAILVLLAVGTLPFVYLMFTPEFPETVPSPGNIEPENQRYQDQVSFFNDFTRYLRLNHGGMIEAEERDRYPEESPEGMLSFNHRYKYIHDDLLIKLIRNYGKEAAIGYKIKKYTYKDKALNKPDSYEVIFFKRSNPWISVKLEWVDEKLYQEKEQIQYTEVTEHSTKDQEEPELPVKDPSQPKLVIVIDDLGNNMEVFQHLIQLDYEITYAVLPQLSFSRETAEIVNRKGHDVMLHLPMQPKEWPKYNPGSGALFLSDSNEMVYQKMEENFKSVPYIVGVNNHMGSAYTQYPEGLDVLMKILASRNLFFMDSKTAPGDLARNIARRNQVIYMSRNIFLDNVQNESYVTGQLYKAVSIAKKIGQAIAIGHPYQVTYQVLSDHLPLLEQDGIQIVPVSALLGG